MFTLMWFYLLLACFLCRPSDKRKPVDTAPSDVVATESDESGCLRMLTSAPKPFTFMLLAVLYVYTNYFTFLALSFTTLTSVTLLDALAVPASMILSRCLLQRRYDWIQLLGVMLCLVGVVVNVASDYDHADDRSIDRQPKLIQGDVFALLAGVLFGLHSVIGEVSVRTLGGPYEYLGNIGMFGAVIAGMHCLLFERDAIVQTFFGKGTSMCQPLEIWGMSTAYVVTGAMSYIGSAQFLLVSEAAFLNLSLLTCNAWALMYTIFAGSIYPTPLFYVALVFTLSGVLVYEMAPSPHAGAHVYEKAQIEKDGGSASETGTSDDTECSESLTEDEDFELEVRICEFA